jgi:hypothetical protein
MVLELVIKHAGQMDVCVTTCRGKIWKDVFNEEWLEELICI